MSRMKVNVYPDISVLSDALLDFVKAFNWKSVVILYQRNEGRFKGSGEFIEEEKLFFVTFGSTLSDSRVD